MNSFRSAVLTGQGLKKNPVLRGKTARGSKDDDLTSVEVPREEARSANHREDDRHRLATETAHARFGGEEHEVDLINLSGGGAMIRADFTPLLFERVDLILGEGGEIECAVRWLRGDRVGLEFAHETRIDCDESSRAELLLDVIHRSFPDIAVEAREAAEPAVPTPEARDEDARSGGHRHPLIWSGEMHYNHSSERVRLRNISATGALIETSLSLPQDAELLLDLGHAGQIFATVSWSRGDKAGLRFERDFDLKQLAKSQPQLAATHTAVAPSFLNLKSTDESPWSHRSLAEIRDDLEGYLKR
jgi:hypothetical protein